LPELTVIGPDGRMNENAGELAGLTQDEAAQRILAWIKERGLLVKREAYRHSVALCERCKSRIEPLISLQWWCAMEELKQPALAALREGRVRYHPPSQHRSRSIRSRTRPIGTSRASSGGATSCRSGSARTAT
jgi:valyl-tRNA synthetase